LCTIGAATVTTAVEEGKDCGAGKLRPAAAGASDHGNTKGTGATAGKDCAPAMVAARNRECLKERQDLNGHWERTQKRRRDKRVFCGKQ